MYTWGIVGQLLYCLIASRNSGSLSTSAVAYGSPISSKIATVAAENPHCGKLRLPFMKIMILFSLTADSIFSIMSAMFFPLSAVLILPRRQRLEGQHMHLHAHRLAHRLIHQFMPFD